ncbi:tripartite tricarboxylate transporter permease [Aquibacillus sp. 3ASR75-11]|uniref:Tripartite tricarboxylate transporter permease n=1 Tax=Terrihalobacillus insolitus TaxID=2950438 RepID=A0A9X3WS22_9BACI|nr:tripartite tricarboxylate transporter permease [Terrihalobacillus insolitus]MDC3412076.1 tripartite tricarboxylate transporter permease [Terrihalobacillus insolitus]MDC3423231.1 tripartite tricarboxylate transporter permease [Terrihalobacillus insolitus]
MENVLLSFETILNVQTMTILLIGVVAGIIVGSIPGFTITMGVALTLPFSFSMDPVNGIALMMGVQVGGSSGGLITACLLGIPGTPSAMATTFDGFPMAKNGEPGKALAIGLWASFIGSIISGVILIFMAPLLAEWALEFGPWEMFALMMFGLSAIASLSEGSLIKGLMSGSLGILFALVGSDPLTAIPRFTFGFSQLSAGFNFLPVLIGLFAFSQLLGDIKNPPQSFNIDQHTNITYPFKKAIKDMWNSTGNVIRSSLIGTFVGILPAAGGSIANILSYDVAKKFSKKPFTFGKGTKEGIIAAESANNSSVGGALVPMLAFGIPGDAVTAMMLGALLIHGIQPGPLLMESQPILVNGVFISFFLAAFLMLLVQSFGIKLFLKINQIPFHYLVPVILLLCVLGSYAVNNRIFDVWVLLLFGLIGYWMKRNQFPLPPFILGIILGPMIESNLRQSISLEPVTTFFTRPISAVLLVLAALSMIYGVYSNMKSNKQLEN